MVLKRRNLLAAMSLLRCIAGAAALRPLAFVGRNRPSPSNILALSRNTQTFRNCHRSFPSLQAQSNDELSMENIYTEWKLDHDQLLWENREKPTPELAALLGRGLRGIETRLAKFKNVNSEAYQRLFAQQQTGGQEEDWDNSKKQKLVPVSEVLRRVQWDYNLSPSDFSILHYDRVDDEVVESPMDAPNESISSSNTQLIDALPEHRILAVKYKEQIVWDRENRLDKVFSNGGIESVMESYDEWKQRKDANEEWLRQRQSQVSTQLKQILGLDRYAAFKALSIKVQSTIEDPSLSAKVEAEHYVQQSLELFRQVMNDPSESLHPSLIPRTETEAVDALSELVALSPKANIRQTVLRELVLVLNELEGGPSKVPMEEILNRELPEVSEDDLEESFVRGSGPGGQKINKTNNKVVLLHKPTQVRVECQDTRSLQQNRKIARKRLRLKLDEFYNGSQSRASIKAEKKSSKKAKAKARSRARNRKKAAAKEAGEKK